MKQRKLFAKEQAVFSSMERTSRKLVYTKLLEGLSFEKIFSQYCEIISFEKRIKNQWHNELLTELSQAQFDGYIFLLYQKIKIKDHPLKKKKSKRVKQVYPKALGYRDAMRRQGTPSANAELFCSITREYLCRKEELNHLLEKMVNEHIEPSAIIDTLTAKYQEEDAKKQERKFLIYTIKYIKQQFNQKQEVPSALINIALDHRFISNRHIFDEQIDIICSTYGAYEDSSEAINVKKICYDFIEHAFLGYKKVDARLINFLFLGDWISLETNNLLYRAQDYLKEVGLNFLVFETIKRLYQKIDLSSDRRLSESDKMICSLYETFKYD